MENKKLITRRGWQALKEKLAKLEKKRPALVERLEHARSMGDLSENSDYQNAREELEFLDQQINEIKAAIASSKVVENGLNAKRVVEVGSQVEVVSDGRKMTFSIVGEMESDPLSGKISDASPLGKALLGKKPGDIVTVNTPAGEKEYRVVALK